jgi:hypothetical protein
MNEEALTETLNEHIGLNVYWMKRYFPELAKEKQMELVVTSNAVWTPEDYMRLLIPVVEGLSRNLRDKVVDVVRSSTELQRLPSLDVLTPSPARCDPEFFKDLVSLIDTNLTSAFHKAVDEICKHLNMDPECFKNLFFDMLPENYRRMA